MLLARVSAGVPFVLGMVFGIIFCWTPGRTQHDVKVAPNQMHPPSSPNATREVSLPNINRDEAVQTESPAERLHKAELELYYLKRERHKLQKALEHRQYARPLRPRHAEVVRRPCT